VKIRILSEDVHGSMGRIENAETGELIRGVISVDIKMRPHGLTVATCEFVGVPIDLIAEMFPVPSSRVAKMAYTLLLKIVEWYG